MINTIDYLFGICHHFIKDQINVTYSIKFSRSPGLDDLAVEIEKKLLDINSFFKELTAPYLRFDKLCSDLNSGNVSPSADFKFFNLDLKNYQFVKLDYLTDDDSSEFVFTISHLISDGISVVALSYYLLNSYDLATMFSYVNYSQMRANSIKFLKEISFRKSRLSQIVKYVTVKKSKSKGALLDLKNYDRNSISVPDGIRIEIALSIVKKNAKKYGISREKFLMLKLAETLLRFYCDREFEECILSHTQNLRLNRISLIDEEIGNYSGRMVWRFGKECYPLFSDFVNKHADKLDGKSNLPALLQEWVSLQCVNRIPRLLFMWIAKTMVNVSKFTATYTYMPMRSSILAPNTFLEKMDTSLIDYAIYLRVIKGHIPYFMFFKGTTGEYSMLLTFNHAFMGRSEAEQLVALYQKLVNS